MFKQAKRKFHISDPDFIQEAKNKTSFFKKDKADFINFDADFNDPFYDSIQLLIEEVENVETNRLLRIQQTQLADIVEENMERCREKFNDAKHFIEKAFPNNTAIWDSFGYKRYRKVRKSHIGFNAFMQSFHRRAMQYATELIAKNYTQAMIDEIETLQKALEEAMSDHRAFKKGRPVETDDRITKLNELYDLIMQVCRAGKRIYKKSWAKYQKYLFKHFKKEKKKKLKAAA
jgi:hypothetical protein